MPNRKTPTSSFSLFITQTSLLPRTVFAPAANTKGVKVLVGTAFELQTANGNGHFVISTSAPSALTDGILVSNLITYISGATNQTISKTIDDLFVPAGYGLYYISSGAGTVFIDASWADA